MKNENRIPEKSEVINDMKEIKKALQHIEAIIKNNKYKPLAQDSLSKFDEYPELDCMKKAFISIIAEKIENLIYTKNAKINGEFKTRVNGQCIEIYNKSRENLEAVKLDLSKQPPLLESTTYNKHALAREKQILEIEIKELAAEKANLLQQLQYDEANSLYTTNTKVLLVNINQRLAKSMNRKDEIDILERIMYKVNFEDFNVIRQLLEETLGINLAEKSVKKITMKQHENIALEMGAYVVNENSVNNSNEYVVGKNGLISGENYIIGENDYAINYVKMIKKFY